MTPFALKTLQLILAESKLPNSTIANLTLASYFSSWEQLRIATSTSIRLYYYHHTVNYISLTLISLEVTVLISKLSLRKCLGRVLITARI